jgi:hypothetical protein
MDLHACPECGDVEVAWGEALIEEEGVLGRRYHGPCARCGMPREFVFAFGALADTSELFDAGQWLAIADMLEMAAGLDVPDAERIESLTIAIACVDEVLKFLPAGADEPSAAAFWSADGRSERDRDPARFARPALNQRRAQLAAQL